MGLFDGPLLALKNNMHLNLTIPCLLLPPLSDSGTSFLTLPFIFLQMLHCTALHCTGGGPSGGDASSSASPEDSSTDDPRDKYAIVVVESGDGGVEVERLIPKQTKLNAPELKGLLKSWTRTALRHLQARYAKLSKTAGFKAAAAAGKKAAKGGKSKKPSATALAAGKSSAGREYLFKGADGSSGGSASSSSSSSSKKVARAKFVNLDAYNVVKGKEGWLLVKDKSGKKAQQWVVYRENTLLTFNDPDDKGPTSTMEGVDSAKFEVKPKKGDAFSIKLTNGKQKLSLICETDLLCQKWQDALQQGKSGSTSGGGGGGKGGASAKPRGPVLKLKSMVPVEDIEEYTEEDEMRDEGRLPPVDSGVYITTQALHALGGLKSGAAVPEDSYLSIGDLSSATAQQEDSYMTVDALDGMLVDSEGSYLTLDAANAVIQGAGFKSLDGSAGAPDTGYLTLADATALVAKLQDDDSYLTVDEMQAAFREDDSYLTVTDMQALGSAGAAAEDAYLTLDSVASLVAASKASGSKKLAKGKIEAALKDQEDGYLTLAEVQSKMKAKVVNDAGEYLSVEMMQDLFVEAGYLSIAEMQALNP